MRSGKLILDLNPGTGGFPDRDTFGSLSNSTIYVVTQSPVAGYELTVACAGPPGGRSTLIPQANGFLIRIRDGEGITCTFTNTDPTASPTPPADTTPPVLTLPPNTTAEASGPSTVVTFAATASDIVDGDGAVLCTPASGAGFALGPTDVTCSAVDSAGNESMGSFLVTVEDTTPPVLALPADIEIDAPAIAASVAVSFEVAALDLVDLAVGPDCTPPSGSLFPVGTTMVTCTATDASGNVASGSFSVTVWDVTPPLLTLPADVRVDELPAGSGSAVVIFDQPSAVDAVDGGVPIDCTHASGDLFPVGETAIECTAIDVAGNAAVGTFAVAVIAVPWSLTVAVQVRHQQPLDVPFRLDLSADATHGGSMFRLDDPAVDDGDAVGSERRFEGTGNGVAAAIVQTLLPGFELTSIHCDGGASCRRRERDADLERRSTRALHLRPRRHRSRQRRPDRRAGGALRDGSDPRRQRWRRRA